MEKGPLSTLYLVELDALQQGSALPVHGGRLVCVQHLCTSRANVSTGGSSDIFAHGRLSHHLNGSTLLTYQILDGAVDAHAAPIGQVRVGQVVRLPATAAARESHALSPHHPPIPTPPGDLYPRWAHLESQAAAALPGGVLVGRAVPGGGG
jgi:hypothetical protein